MVECDLAKVDVEGSNPFRRSILLRPSMRRLRYGFAGMYNVKEETYDEDNGFLKHKGDQRRYQGYG